MHRATEHICKLYQRFYTQTIYPKVIRNLYATPPSLFVPSAPPRHCVYLRPHYISLLIYPPYFGRAFYYPVIMSLITLLPYLLLPCLMSPITLLPCLLLLCYHVSYYPVSCLPLPCLHQGMQNHKKRVDKLIIPRIHTPQNN